MYLFDLKTKRYFHNESGINYEPIIDTRERKPHQLRNKMPKTYLSFKLPEEKNELMCAMQGQILAIAFYDLDNWLRNKYKYENINEISVTAVRSKIRDILDSHKITVVK